MEYYLAIKKKEILPFVNNMDETWGDYAKWNIRQRNQILYNLRTYGGGKKKNS